MARQRAPAISLDNENVEDNVSSSLKLSDNPSLKIHTAHPQCLYSYSTLSASGPPPPRSTDELLLQQLSPSRGAARATHIFIHLQAEDRSPAPEDGIVQDEKRCNLGWLRLGTTSSRSWTSCPRRRARRRRSSIYKRRQNTLAARKSRKRKLEH
ncbi:hypothetical protein DFH06DRAFT_1343119 [Mycena polygramma]|nr:hypothetical protein DFH06DRAFT_1343119 [Mycena polygramma]